MNSSIVETIMKPLKSSAFKHIGEVDETYYLAALCNVNDCMLDIKTAVGLRKLPIITCLAQWYRYEDFNKVSPQSTAAPLVKGDGIQSACVQEKVKRRINGKTKEFNKVVMKHSPVDIVHAGWFNCVKSILTRINNIYKIYDFGAYTHVNLRLALKSVNLDNQTFYGVKIDSLEVVTMINDIRVKLEAIVFIMESPMRNYHNDMTQILNNKTVNGLGTEKGEIIDLIDNYAMMLYKQILYCDGEFNLGYLYDMVNDKEGVDITNILDSIDDDVMRNPEVQKVTDIIRKSKDVDPSNKKDYIEHLLSAVNNIKLPK